MVDRFRPAKTETEDESKANFFIRIGGGKKIKNPTKEMDLLQEKFNLPSCTSGTARIVLETVTGKAGLDVDTRSGNKIRIN